MSSDENEEPPVHGHASARLVLVRLILVQLLLCVANSGYLLLPKYLTHAGANARVIGMVAASVSVAVVAATPLAAWLVDQVSRLALIRAGALLLAVSSLGFLAVPEPGPLMLALRAAQGVSFSLTWSALAALIVDAAPRGRLGRSLGYLGAAGLASQALAPAVFEPLTARLGWSALFVGSALLAGMALASTLRMPRVVVAAGSELPEKVGGGPSATAVACVIVSVAMGFGFGAVMTFVPPLAIERGASSISGLFLGYTAAALAARIFGGGLGDTCGHRRVALLSLGGYSAVVFGFVGLRPGVLPALGAGLGVAHGLLFPSLTAMALNAAPANRRGRVQTYLFGAFHLGAGLSGIVLGAIAHKTGLAGLFVVAGVVSASSVLPLARVARGAVGYPSEPLPSRSAR